MLAIYTQQDYNAAHRASRGAWLALAAIIAVSLAIIVTTLIVRIAWLGYCTALLGTAAVIFYWGLIAQRVVGYHRFLLEMDKGRERSLEGVVESIGSEPVESDHVQMICISVQALPATPGKDTSRRLYYDYAKLPVPFTQNQRVRLLLYGNYIKSYEAEP